MANNTLICEECGDFKHPKEGCPTCKRRKLVTDFIGVSPEKTGPFMEQEEKMEKELERVKKEVRDIHEFEWGLEAALHDILRKKILSDGYLSKIKWQYRSRSLYPIDPSTNPAVDTLIDLWVKNYSDYMNLSLVERERWAKISIGYNDGELRLDFDEMEDILPFCEEYGMDVDFGSLMEKKERLVKELGEVVALMERFVVTDPKPTMMKMLSYIFSDYAMEEEKVIKHVSKDGVREGDALRWLGQLEEAGLVKRELLDIWWWSYIVDETISEKDRFEKDTLDKEQARWEKVIG